MEVRTTKTSGAIQLARPGVLEFNGNELLFSLGRRDGGGEGCAPPSQITSPLRGSVTLELSSS